MEIFFTQIYYIQSWLQDHVMVLGVLCLVVIDLAILGAYSLVEGVRGNLGVKLTSNREFPEETIGVSWFFYMQNVAVIHRVGMGTEV